MMNFPGVLNKDSNVMAKIQLAKSLNKCIDGHAPYLSQKDLCAYIASGVKSDHECTNFDEAKEKLRLGMYIMIREGTAAKDLDALMPLLKSSNTRKFIFVTDDRHPADLKVHINGMVRRTVEAGINPINAIQIASLNTAEYFGIKNLGAIAPGYRADILVLPDLISFKPDMVFKNGKLVAEKGKIVNEIIESVPIAARNSVNVRWITPDDFKIEEHSELVPMQPGDVPVTYADTTALSPEERRVLWGLMIGNEGKTRFAVHDHYRDAGFNPDTDMLRKRLSKTD